MGVRRARSRIATPTILRVQPPAGDYGPTYGAQWVRDNAGPGTVSVFPGTPGVNFTQLVPANTQTQNQTAIDNDTTGKIWWPAGIYRLDLNASYRVRLNQEHRFQTGPLRTSADTAIVKGSAVVTGWVQDGALWKVTGQTQDFTSFHGTVPSHITNPVAGDELEDYYYDGVPLIAVTSQGAVAAGKKWLDRATDTCWIGDDPTGHTVERLTNWRDGGLLLAHGDPPVSNVTIKGGIFEHAGKMCVAVGLGIYGTEDNIVLEDMEMRYGHHKCFQADGSDGFRMARCYLHHGGAYNYTVYNAASPIIEYCELSYGNSLAFGDRTVGSDDEGGSKNGLNSGTFTWRYNWSHHHDGEEWWDTDDASISISESVVEDCYRWGVNLEDVAAPNSITRCLFRNNGQVHPTWSDWSPSSRREASNLYFAAANGITVDYCWLQSLFTNNLQTDVRISWQVRSRATGPQGLRFQNNRVDRTNLPGGTYEGIISGRQAAADPWYTTSDNKFDSNEYHIPTGQSTEQNWFQREGFLTWSQWRAGGTTPYAPASFYDPNSTITADL